MADRRANRFSFTGGRGWANGWRGVILGASWLRSEGRDLPTRCPRREAPVTIAVALVALLWTLFRRIGFFDRVSMTTDSDEKRELLAGHDRDGLQRAGRDPADKAVGDEQRLAAQKLGHERSEVGRLQRLLEGRTQALSIANEKLDLRDEFLAIVSHDLRNPLNAIALNTQLLERLVSSGDPRLGRISRSLHSSIAQMQRIISDLLDLAAIEAGKLSVQLRPGDARNLIEEAVETSRSVSAEKSIALDAGIGPDPLPARFDPGRIVQVLDNLIHNALKFTPNGGRISVEGRRMNHVVEIRVRYRTRSETGGGLGDLRPLPAGGEAWEAALGLGLYIPARSSNRTAVRSGRRAFREKEARSCSHSRRRSRRCPFFLPGTPAVEDRDELLELQRSPKEPLDSGKALAQAGSRDWSFIYGHRFSFSFSRDIAKA